MGVGAHGLLGSLALILEAGRLVKLQTSANAERGSATIRRLSEVGSIAQGCLLLSQTARFMEDGQGGPAGRNALRRAAWQSRRGSAVVATLHLLTGAAFVLAMIGWRFTARQILRALRMYHPPETVAGAIGDSGPNVRLLVEEVFE